ncbi:MAG: 4Fe-4S binding protein, partial [Bacteroidales bacterium]|nr:4Fe-4S binding protein [Bacteroidales bacterium]
NIIIKSLNCSECGQCIKRCPFGVKIIDKMKEIKTLFSHIL